MNILAISPHTDDAELGCGGSLARMVAEGHSVEVLALGTGNADSGATVQEYRDSMNVLGISDFYTRDYRCRKYHERRQDILDCFVAFDMQQELDIVFVPSTANVHQDHEVVTAEALRAFRSSSMLGYEMPWGDHKQAHFPFYITLGREELIKKCEAVACYKSQEVRGYTDKGFLYSLATVRGVQSGKGGFAEAFEVLKWIQ